MKNLLKISAVLTCVSLMFALSACGNKDNTESEKNTSAVTQIAQESETATQNTKQASGGDIVLPEDGKITFGEKKNETADAQSKKESTTTTTTEKPNNGKTTTTKSTESKTTTTKTTTTKPKITKTTKTTTTTKKTTTTTTTKPTQKTTTTTKSGSAADDKDWSGISWN